MENLHEIKPYPAKDLRFLVKLVERSILWTDVFVNARLLNEGSPEIQEARGLQAVMVKQLERQGRNVRLLKEIYFEANE